MNTERQMHGHVYADNVKGEPTMVDNKKFEMSDDNMNRVSGGTDDWYNGWGYPPDYPNGCPKCGGGVYTLMGASLDYHCDTCDYTYLTSGELPLGHYARG